MVEHPLFREFESALSDEIRYLKERGGETKFVCKHGILIHAKGNRHVYEFILESPTSLEEDTPISIRFNSETILGSIVCIEGVKITLALNQDIGQKVPEVIVVANPSFLLEMLKEKLNELGASKIPGNISLALKVFGEEKAVIGSDTHFLSRGIAELNREQREAVAKCLGSELAFVWGPPGTGKTFLLAQLVSEFLARNKTVLITSHTNIAIDNALERLSRAFKEENNLSYQDGKVLRIGSPQLPTLFTDYPELDVDYWVEKKGRIFREKLEQLEQQLQALHERMESYTTALRLFDESEKLERKRNQLDEDSKVLDRKLKNIQEEVNGLKNALAVLEDKLRRAENTNAIGRFFRGLNIEKIRRDISETKQLVLKRETDLQSCREALERTKVAIAESHGQLTSKKEELQSLFEKLGTALTKQGAAYELRKLEGKANELSKEKKTLEEELANLERQIISQALVVGTTLTKTYLNEAIWNRQFDAVVVDEAGMAPMPALFFACSLSREKAVIIGDFRQLAPIAQCDSNIVQKWLGRDIFEQAGITCAVNNNQTDERLVALREQRRMPEEVVRLVNDVIYGGMLRNGAKAPVEISLEQRVVAAPPSPGNRIVICDTSAVNPWCSRSAARSRFNVYNAFLSVKLAELAAKHGVTDIGIITPYRSQSKLIHELVADREDSPIDPSSVHRFQGREKQLIIFDLVEGPVRNIKWLNGSLDTDAARLINVGVTRTKAKLVFVANLEYLDKKLAADSVLRHVLDKAQKSGAILDSREFLTFVDVAGRRGTSSAVGLPPGGDEPAIYTEVCFYEKFREDLQNAKDSVVIMSPFITVDRTTQFEELFRALLAKGIKLYIVTRPPEEQVGQLRTMAEEMISELKKLGIEIIPRKKLHEKLAIVDNRIIWHGSLNILSHKNTSELMARFLATPSWTSTLLNVCGVSIGKITFTTSVKKKLAEINETGVGQCPSGHKLVVKRGRFGIFVSCSEYPQCKTALQPDASVIEAVYGAGYLQCENCGAKMQVKYSPKNKRRFLGCSVFSWRWADTGELRWQPILA